MRRSAVLCLLAGATILASACSSDDPQSNPMGPTAEAVPDNQANIGLRCRNNGLIVLQLAAILSAKPPARLYQQAVVKFALVEVALLTRKKPLAQRLALDLIDFLTDNRNNLINPNTPLTRTRLANVIDAILCIVGLEPTGVTIGPNTGIGVVPANNQQPVIITTPSGNAGLLVPTNFAPDRDVNDNPIPGVVVTVTGNLTTGLNTPLDQYGQTVDLTASQEVIWRNGGVVVALCVSTDTELAIFNRLRIGHQGGLGPFFGLIEILPVASVGDVSAILGTCAPGSGNRSTFGSLREFAARVLLPSSLHAAAIAVTGGVGGTTKRFSPFRAVDPLLTLEAVSPTETSGTAGAPVAEPPAVRVSTDSGHPVPGVDVTFEVTEGEGEVEPAEVATNSDGIAATDSWVLGLGPNTVVATPQPPIPGGEGEVHATPPITFVPPSETFTAQGTVDPIGYGSGGYSFLLLGADAPPEGWFLPGPTPGDAWSIGTAPFGQANATCSVFENEGTDVATAWPAGSSATASGLLVRRAFTTPVDFGGDVVINVAVDNDIQVYLDGQDVTQVGFVGTANDDDPDGSWQTFLSPFQRHEGCAQRDDGSFTIPNSALGEGSNHLIAVYANDRGGASYLDLKVTLTE